MITPALQALVNKIATWQQDTSHAAPGMAPLLAQVVTTRLTAEVCRIYLASYPLPAAGQSPSAYLQAIEAVHVANAQELRQVLPAGLHGPAFTGANQAFSAAAARVLT